jgi:HSP20 family protein
MAEVKVKRNEEAERKGGGHVARRGEHMPFWRPADFFRASPFGLLQRFNEEMDRAFSRWGGEHEGWGAFAPAIEVTEREGNLVVCADLPGMNKDDVKIEVSGDELVIQGERKREHEETREGYRRSERSYGHFYRSVPLPEGAEIEKARAEFKDGVLEVKVPVPEGKSKRRQIPIG